jgi:hypothetical protein
MMVFDGFLWFLMVLMMVLVMVFDGFLMVFEAF